MRRFDHPCVLKLLACFVSGRQLWMVTPFMGQGSIRSVMLRHFPQGLEEVVVASIMRYVLLGLQYVHKNGGIHRDIKAENILISEAGQVCLGDFGVAATCLASLMDHHQQQQHQQRSSAGGADVAPLCLGPPAELRAKTFVGTPCWMAPEVLAPQDDEGYDASADIWSVGITLMELALGKPPLARLPPMRIILNTVINPPPTLQDSPDGRKFSKAFKDVVSACLSKDPPARPTAAELLNHRFFKQAKGSAFLQSHLLSGVPQQASSHRARVKKGSKEMMQPAVGGSGRKFSEWLFPPGEGREGLQRFAAGAAAEHQLDAIAAGPSSTAPAAAGDYIAVAMADAGAI
ncbi:putative serine/threonine protein kinase [Scenedesmus sp. NREL 46B-D3]|nr:putative serine/threonine protein kinase [Scenedesmus sp. NREL 46B-D3]